MPCFTRVSPFSIRRHFTRGITLTLLLSSAFADTVYLKSGGKIEGRVLRETDQQITIELKVSAGITDERVIPRKEIDRIEKTSPETEAYKALSTLLPGADSLTATQYEEPIRTLQTYLARYPTSLHAKDVQATLQEFLTEKKRVEGGEVKLRGAWLSKAEAEEQKIQIGGLLAFEHMRDQSVAGDGIGALNTFAIIEKNYAGALTMPESIELAKQVVASLKPGLERALPNQLALKAQKEAGFASASPTDRIEMQAAYKAEIAQAEAAVAAAEKAGQWPPFIAGSEKSIKALLSRLARESTRLAAFPVEKMRQSAQLTVAARQHLATDDTTSATTALKEATGLWPANELAGRLTKEIAATEKAKALKEVPPTPTPTTPEPSTPKPQPAATPKPSAANRAPAPAPVAAGQEDARPFFHTLPGAITIVVSLATVLAGLNIFQKIRARNYPID